jgi:23S rRNA (uridine2552-2'-O)-methyltransferase
LEARVAMAKNWYNEKKSEPWYRRAKREGYRARSAFKLMQIQERLNVLRAGDTVIDLGAAPGGWSQVAAELVGPTGRVIGIDLVPIGRMPRVQFVQGDMTKESTVEAVLRLLTTDERGVRVDAVISDMSPNLTGNYSMDQANSIWLCEHAFAFALRVLDAGGTLVMKVFEGEDFPEFRDRVKAAFHTVKAYNPPASRKQSSEIYLVAAGFKGSKGRSEASPRSSSATRPS